MNKTDWIINYQKKKKKKEHGFLPRVAYLLLVTKPKSAFSA